MQGEVLVFSVPQQVVCPQSVQIGAGDLAGQHRIEACLDGGIQRYLGFRIVPENKVILHPVVFVDRDMFRRPFRKGTFVNQLGSHVDHRGRLVQTAFFGEIQAAAHGESHIDPVRRHVGDHGVITLIARVGDLQTGDPQFGEDLRDDVLDHARHLTVRICPAVRHIIFQITDPERMMRLQPFLFAP